MIRKLLGTMVLILVGAALMYYALGRHFVETKNETVIVPKKRLRLADTWVDISDWDQQDFRDHPKLKRALIDNGHEDLVDRPAGDRLRDWLKEKASDMLETE